MSEEMKSKKLEQVIAKWLVGIGIVIVIFGLILWISEYRTKAGVKAKAEKVAAEKYAAAHPPAQRIVPQSERPWSFRTLEIPADGIPVHLSSGWRGFTQGGAITITTPSGKIFHDKPGVPTELGFQPDGMYVFRGDPVGSKRSMVIYNRW